MPGRRSVLVKERGYSVLQIKPVLPQERELIFSAPVSGFDVVHRMQSGAWRVFLRRAMSSEESPPWLVG